LRLLERVDQQYPPSQRGDMLVFLSGMNEITALADELMPYAAQTKRWVVREPCMSSLFGVLYVCVWCVCARAL
jgi:HrpA-like RNA helicase